MIKFIQFLIANVAMSLKLHTIYGLISSVTTKKTNAEIFWESRVEICLNRGRKIEIVNNDDMKIKLVQIGFMQWIIFELLTHYRNRVKKETTRAVQEYESNRQTRFIRAKKKTDVNYRLETYTKLDFDCMRSSSVQVLNNNLFL